MSKKKLIHFQENLTFPHLIQPDYKSLISGFSLQSHWNEQFFKNTHPIVAELGCGKGEFTVELARRYPEKNYIGIDWKGSRLWRGCKTVDELKMKNACFIRSLVDHVDLIFATGEISEFWITFPDPQPKKENHRLTAPRFLEKYRKLMVPGGTVHLKTDDPDFFHYTLNIIRDHQHRLLWSTADLYHSGYEGDVTKIQSFYEKMWLEKEKKICYLQFQLNRL